jgi:hypothetical protein
MNALKVLKFYLMGYRMQAKYFTDNCDTYQAVIIELRTTLLSIDTTSSSDLQALLTFAQSLHTFLTLCMSIYSGHPELYSRLQDYLGELAYDSQGKLSPMDDSEIERQKQAGLWVSMAQQEELQKFEGTVQAPQEDNAGGAS